MELVAIILKLKSSREASGIRDYREKLVVVQRRGHPFEMKGKGKKSAGIPEDASRHHAVAQST
jgi:hypothetical protein